MRSLFTLGCLVSLVAACGDNGGDDEPPTEVARIRVVHASPDAPAVDVFAQGGTSALVTNLAYGETSPYVEVDAATYVLEVRPTGQPTAVFTTGAIALAADRRYTAIAAGFVTSTDAADQFRVLPLEEGFVAPAAGNVAIRVVHASADAPTVGIDVGADDPGAPEVPSLARFADTGAAGIALPSGTALRVGIAAGGDTVTTFTTPPLPDRAELIVIAIGRLGDLPRLSTGFSLLAIADAGAIGTLKQDPTVYALHASPDAPNVDIREASADALLLGDVPYGAIGGVQVPPGDYTLDFYAAGSAPGKPAASATVDGLLAGERYLAIATGFLSPVGPEEPFQLLAIRDELEVDAAAARLAAVHASPDAPVVDVSTAAGGQLDQPALIQDLAFGDQTAGAGLAVPPADLTLGVAAAGTPAAVATFDVTTVAGLRAFVVATGALSPAGGEEGFALTIVNTAVTPWTATAIAPE